MNPPGVLAALRSRAAPWWLFALALTALGLALRWHLARTFDGPVRGSDYEAYIKGVRWVLEHRRTFDAALEIQVGFYPPLWYVMGAAVLSAFKVERAIAGLSVGGWVVRQLLLWRWCARDLPRSPRSAAVVLGLHAVIPMSVLMDGKVNPEGPHATLFALGAFAIAAMERRLRDRAPGVEWASLLAGVASGLAVLTKATSAVLVMVASASLLLAAWRAQRRDDRRGLRIVAVAGAAFALGWAAVAGWWCLDNVLRFGSPLPHQYGVKELEFASTYPALREPLTHRRTLGWALPVETDWLDAPHAASVDLPRPNFWSSTIGGTWSDWYNRGFCRLTGGPTLSTVWGPDAWAMPLRCVNIDVSLVRFGVAFTAAIAAAWAWLLRRTWRSRGLDGSVTALAASALPVVFAMAFAWTWSIDRMAVVKASYLLPVALPMLVCLALGLGRLESLPHPRIAAHRALALATLCVASLVTWARWGH